MEFNVGDKVLLQLALDYKDVPKGLQRWDECQFIVSKKSYICGGRIYELQACRSEKGVPYAIDEDWLVPIG